MITMSNTTQNKSVELRDMSIYTKMKDVYGINPNVNIWTKLVTSNNRIVSRNIVSICYTTDESEIVSHGYPHSFSYEINERTGEVIIIAN